ncbi:MULTISPECIES: hypothetical protein [Azospirillaceae]|jgi:hypothetical protein|nr:MULTISPECIES: hypothetical protein [Azospirillaceae]MDG5494578.1 hypothetical protein [Niveispirillum sp. BGYR6]SNS38344.1 hypothetical protein SAMN05880556_104188 [Azospirillum sp. RU38E]SNS56938.1 hypothetical protein SAMN05880591_104188 [Azospirillum sp. RU37A]
MAACHPFVPSFKPAIATPAEIRRPGTTALALWKHITACPFVTL